MTHGAYFYFLEGIVNGVQHPVIAYPYSISLAATKLFGPRGPGIGFHGPQPFDDLFVNLPGQTCRFFLRRAFQET